MSVCVCLSVGLSVGVSRVCVQPLQLDLDRQAHFMACPGSTWLPCVCGSVVFHCAPLRDCSSSKFPP